MPSVRKNISAIKKSDQVLLAALALSAFIQAANSLGTMASAAGPTLRPIPESASKAAADKPDTSKAVKPTKPLAAPAKSAPIKSAHVSRPSMVPPPPPNTPSMLSDFSLAGLGYGGAYGMQVEYMSREALKDRVKEVSIQAKDATAELESRKRLKLERETRAKRLEQLFAEGVVSRRELESSQREAIDSTDEVQRLQNKCNELTSLLERVNKRLASFPQPPSRKTSQKAQQKLKKSQAKIIAPAKQQIKAAEAKLIN
ncbi:hypothetical protein BH11CYA1_BH11CYA1_45630 [soil metagenome]